MENAAGLAAFLDLVSFLIVASLTLAIIGTSASEKLKSLARYLPVAGIHWCAGGCHPDVAKHVKSKSNRPRHGNRTSDSDILQPDFCNAKAGFSRDDIARARQLFHLSRFCSFFIMGIYSVLILSFI